MDSGNQFQLFSVFSFCGVNEGAVYRLLQYLYSLKAHFSLITKALHDLTALKLVICYTK